MNLKVNSIILSAKINIDYVCTSSICLNCILFFCSERRSCLRHDETSRDKQSEHAETGETEQYVDKNDKKV